MENNNVMSAQQPQRTSSDGNPGTETIQQIINERNQLRLQNEQLRSQNDQLWKIIEKQKSVINNLQKDNQKLAHERDKVITRLRELDNNVSPVEKEGGENKFPAESNGSNNSININNHIDSAVPSMDNSKYSHNPTPPIQPVRQSSTPIVYSNQSKQPTQRQMSLSDKGSSPHDSFELKPHPQRQDSSVSDVSVNEVSLSGLLKSYGEADTHVVPIDDANSTSNDGQPKREIHQLRDEDNSMTNEHGIDNESFSSIANDSRINIIPPLINSDLIKPPHPSPPVPPPKSIQRQQNDRSLNLTEIQDKQDSPRNSQKQSEPVPLNNVEQSVQGIESSVSQNPPSPTISVKSSGSESVSSNVGNTKYTHDDNNDDGVAQAVDTVPEPLDENGALDQFPQPAPREQHPKFLENNSVHNLDSVESHDNGTSAEKDPEPLGLSSSSSLPPRSPGLPSSPMYGNESRKPNDDVESPKLPRRPSDDVESPKLPRRSSDDVEPPKPPRRSSNESPKSPVRSSLDSEPPKSLRIPPGHNGELNMPNNTVNKDNVNNNRSIPNIVQQNPIEKNSPIRSQSLPPRDNDISQPIISVPGNDSEDSSTKSRRDSLTHNHSDSNLGRTYLSTDASQKEKVLRASKSFNYISPGPRARVSAMPPPRGGQYPELRSPGLNANALSVPSQNSRHSVYISGQNQKDSPAVERVSQHIKNKRSLPDAAVVTNPSYGHQQQQMSQQQSQQQQGFTQQQKRTPQKSVDPQTITSDAISGIAVKIIGSNKKINDKGKEVLAFIISVGHARAHDSGMEKELWRVEKLYSDFLALDSKLKQRQNKSTVNKIGKLPDKNLFYNNAPSKVDQRKIALEQYLQHVISLPLKDSKDLCEFLSSNVIDQEEKVNRQSGFKEGYLTKKGKNFGGWKSRYFLLNSPVLDYYESKGGSHLGSIRLTYAQIGRQQSNANNEPDKDSDNSYRHAFLILEPKSGSKNKHVLCAESDAERDEWVEALLQYVGVGEEEVQNKKNPKKKFPKEMIAKVNAQPISQLEKNDLNNKLITSDHVIQQTQKDIRSDRKNESISSLSTTVRGDSISYSSHHPSSSLSSSPSSTSSIQQSDQWVDQSKNQQQSMLGVSSNPIIKRGSVLANREDQDKTTRNGNGAPDRDNAASPVGGTSVNNPSQASYPQGRRQHDDISQVERKKTSRKTFFGSMFGGGNKDDKKKYHETRLDMSKVVFGVSLDQAIAVARIKEGYELPAVLYRCIEYLDAKNATEEEGIYRLSGATATIKTLKERFNSEGDVDLLGEGVPYDVHAVAGLLKLYLRELPTSVLTRELHAEFVNVIDLLDRRDRVNELGRLVSSLPLSNYTLLRTLTGHLIRIVQNSDINKMTVRNIGIVFSPTLGIPAGVFSLFMAEFDYIFFTDSNGTAAPRSIDELPSENVNEKSSSRTSKNNTSIDTSQDTTNIGSDGDTLSPSALSPITALRRRDLREDINGRSNRNSMHYMDGAPESVVGLERKLTVSKTLRRNDSSDEEEVNDLALRADEDDDAESLSSASDELTPSPPNSSVRSLPVSAPVSPRLPMSNGYPQSNSSSGTHVEFTGDTNPETDSPEMRKMQRLAVRNFTEQDSMYEVHSEHHRMTEVLGSQNEVNQV